MDIIISVDVTRKKVLVLIHDTFNIECSPTKEIEELVSGSNEKVLDQVIEKLETCKFTFPTIKKWRYIVRAKGYATAECSIIEK
jgi:hypothetical protein